MRDYVCYFDPVCVCVCVILSVSEPGQLMRWGCACVIISPSSHSFIPHLHLRNPVHHKPWRVYAVCIVNNILLNTLSLSLKINHFSLHMHVAALDSRI